MKLKRIPGERAAVFHGWSMGFEKYATTTTVLQWERKWVVRGLIAALIAAVAVGLYTWAVIAIGAPAALLAMATIGIAVCVFVYFYSWLNGLTKEEGE